jgi:hypothetical protein
MGGLPKRGAVLVLVVGMPHLSPKLTPRMPDADHTHIQNIIFPNLVLVSGEGKGEGDGHASSTPEASESHA